jgi:hypothetical protein
MPPGGAAFSDGWEYSAVYGPWEYSTQEFFSRCARSSLIEANRKVP